MTTSTPVNTVETTFRVVECLRDAGAATVSELTAELEVPTSTIHDHLRTLESLEYVVNDDGVYSVGARFLEIGDRYRSGTKLYRVGASEVDELAEETGEHANIMIEEHGLGVFLYTARGADAVHLDTHPGMRVGLHTTALGKAILAHLPRDRVAGIFDRRGLPRETPNTMTSRTALLERFERIRERGYAFDDEERMNGMRCVAAPVTDGDGRSVGAISVSGPKHRLRGERYETEVPNLVLQSANVVEVNYSNL